MRNESEYRLWSPSDPNVKALLSLTGCTTTYRPERWHRGAKRHATYYVYKNGNIAGGIHIRSDATVHEWHRQLGRYLDRINRENQANPRSP